MSDLESFLSSDGRRLYPQMVPIERGRTADIPPLFLDNPDFIYQPGFRHTDGDQRQTVFLAPGIELDDSWSAGIRLPDLEYVDSRLMKRPGKSKRWTIIQAEIGSTRSAAFFEALLAETSHELRH